MTNEQLLRECVEAIAMSGGGDFANKHGLDVQIVSGNVISYNELAQAVLARIDSPEPSEVEATGFRWVDDGEDDYSIRMPDGHTGWIVSKNSSLGRIAAAQFAAAAEARVEDVAAEFKEAGADEVHTLTPDYPTPEQHATDLPSDGQWFRWASGRNDLEQGGVLWVFKHNDGSQRSYGLQGELTSEAFRWLLDTPWTPIPTSVAHTEIRAARRMSGKEASTGPKCCELDSEGRACVAPRGHAGEHEWIVPNDNGSKAEPQDGSTARPLGWHSGDTAKAIWDASSPAPATVKESLTVQPDLQAARREWWLNDGGIFEAKGDTLLARGRFDLNWVHVTELRDGDRIVSREEWDRIINHTNDVTTQRDEEKSRRIYYQQIVYDACCLIDVADGRSTSKGTCVCCGNSDFPSREVQDTLLRLLRTRENALSMVEKLQNERQRAEAAQHSSNKTYAVEIQELQEQVAESQQQLSEAKQQLATLTKVNDALMPYLETHHGVTTTKAIPMMLKEIEELKNQLSHPPAAYRERLKADVREILSRVAVESRGEASIPPIAECTDAILAIIPQQPVPSPLVEFMEIWTGDWTEPLFDERLRKLASKYGVSCPSSVDCARNLLAKYPPTVCECSKMREQLADAEARAAENAADTELLAMLKDGRALKACNEVIPGKVNVSVAYGNGLIRLFADYYGEGFCSCVVEKTTSAELVAWVNARLGEKGSDNA